MKMRTKVFLAAVLVTALSSNGQPSSTVGADSTNYSIQIGSPSEDIRLRSSINLTGEINLGIGQ